MQKGLRKNGICKSSHFSPMTQGEFVLPVADYEVKLVIFTR